MTEIATLKQMGVNELERLAALTDMGIRSLNDDRSEDGIREREELVNYQNALNEARAELLEESGASLPPDVVVGLKPAYMRPRIAKDTGNSN